LPEEAEKGRHRVQIDLHDVEATLERLVPHADDDIRHLTQEVHNDFNQLTNYVKLVYGKDEYKKIYDIIQNKFKDVKDIKAFTIASYVAGCSSHIHGKDGEAAVISQICAGGFQNPEYPEHHPYTIYTGEYSHGRFSFFKQVDGSTDECRKTALIYVNFTSEKTFPGFCEGEIKDFQNAGIDTVIIKGLNGRKPITFYKNELNILNVKRRKSGCGGGNGGNGGNGGGGNGGGGNGTTSNTNMGAIAAIIIVVIVIIILFLIIFSRNKRM